MIKSLGGVAGSERNKEAPVSEPSMDDERVQGVLVYTNGKEGIQGSSLLPSSAQITSTRTILLIMQKERKRRENDKNENKQQIN